MKQIFKVFSYLKYLNFGKYLNWNKLLSKIFGAHTPDADTKILKDEESFGIKYALVIRRSLRYSVFKSFYIIFSLFLLVVNIYLLYKQDLVGLSQNVLGLILTLNVVYGSYVFFMYLIHFYRLNKGIPKVDSIYKWIQRSEKGDKYYEEFLNQTVTNIVIFTIVFIYIIIGVFLSSTGEYNYLWVSLNTILLIVQISLLYKVKIQINNQEMDFVIITPNQLYVYDQLGYTNTDNNNFPIVKVRNVKETYGPKVKLSSKLGSVLKFGTLKFLLDGGGSGEAGEDGDISSAPQFTYVGRHELVKKEASLFIDKIENGNGTEEYKYKQMIHTIPVILTQVLYNLNINIDKNLDKVINENKYYSEIKEYLLQHKDFLRKEYQRGRNVIKKEIEELGIKYGLNS